MNKGLIFAGMCLDYSCIVHVLLIPDGTPTPMTPEKYAYLYVKDVQLFKSEVSDNNIESGS